MPHYYRNQQIVGWGPTVQEIDALATIIDEIVHLGCMHKTPAPTSSLPYQSNRIRFIPLQAVGGEKFSNKMDVLRRSPEFIAAIKKWLPWGDVIHVRCPANIPLIALTILATSKVPKYRWVKYAGNWRPAGKEAWSYTFQRWILKNNLHHGLVTINGEWTDQSKHVHSFYNPSFTMLQKNIAFQCARTKELKPPYYFLFVGRMESAKGMGTVLDVASKIKESKFAFRLDLIGDGPERVEFENMANCLNLLSHVHFHGWLPRSEIDEFYRKAHFILLPSSASEGWPKVLSEGMAYGVVPLASNVSSIPQILSKLGTGVSLHRDAVQDFASAILNYINNPVRWETERNSGMAAAALFTYESYLDAVKKMFQDEWNISLKK